MNITMKLGGVGGQGIQFIAKLIGKAAFMEGLNVSQATKYEPSTKGGLTAADITIAPDDEEIIFPFIQDNPDILLVLAQRAWEEYKILVGPDTIILADKDNVPNFDPPELVKLSLHLPFSAKAREIGNETSTNMVALGFIAELLDMNGHYLSKIIASTKPEEYLGPERDLLEVAPEHFTKIIIETSPKRFQDVNLKAFKAGYELSKNTDYCKEAINAPSAKFCLEALNQKKNEES